MRFVLPYRKGLPPRWMLRLGLFIYDHLSGRTTLPGTATLDLRRHPAGAPLKPGSRHGYAYSDGWEIGRAHDCTPVTNAHPVCRPLHDKNNHITQHNTT